MEGRTETHLNVEGIEANQPVAVDDIADFLRELAESFVLSSSPSATVTVAIARAAATAIAAATIIDSHGCPRFIAVLTVAPILSPGLAAVVAISVLIILSSIASRFVSGFSGAGWRVEVGQELPHVLALREKLEVEREGAHLLDEVHLIFLVQKNGKFTHTRNTRLRALCMDEGYAIQAITTHRDSQLFAVRREGEAKVRTKTNQHNNAT